MINNLTAFNKLLDKEKEKISPELLSEIYSLISEVQERRIQLRESFLKVSNLENHLLGQAINNKNL